MVEHRETQGVVDLSTLPCSATCSASNKVYRRPAEVQQKKFEVLSCASAESHFNTKTWVPTPR